MFGTLIPSRTVNTDFTQLSETTLQQLIPDFHLVKFITIFAISPPELPENYAFSVYIQPQNQPKVLLGQISKHAFSISKAVNFLQKDSESTCILQIQVEEYNSQELANDQSMKLLQVGVALSNDFEKFITSFDDVYHEGNHYVQSDSVMGWINNIDARIKNNQRFWDGVE